MRARRPKRNRFGPADPRAAPSSPASRAPSRAPFSAAGVELIVRVVIALTRAIIARRVTRADSRRAHRCAGRSGARYGFERRRQLGERWPTRRVEFEAGVHGARQRRRQAPNGADPWSARLELWIDRWLLVVRREMRV